VEEEKQIAASIDRALLTRYKNTPKKLLDGLKASPEQELLQQKLLLELEL
jgi:ATP-dependent Clp protease protease subunit